MRRRIHLVDGMVVHDAAAGSAEFADHGAESPG
jgi:hypothetical protein